MSILLNDDELFALHQDIHLDRAHLVPAVAKAQLKAVVEWGEKLCEEHPGEYGVQSKHYCGICWEALLEEVE